MSLEKAKKYLEEKGYADGLMCVKKFYFKVEKNRQEKTWHGKIK